MIYSFEFTGNGNCTSITEPPACVKYTWIDIFNGLKCIMEHQNYVIVNEDDCNCGCGSEFPFGEATTNLLEDDGNCGCGILYEGDLVEVVSVNEVLYDFSRRRYFFTEDIELKGIGLTDELQLLMANLFLDGFWLPSFPPIKLWFGERGNQHNIRPKNPKVVAYPIATKGKLAAHPILRVVRFLLDLERSFLKIQVRVFLRLTEEQVFESKVYRLDREALRIKKFLTS
ncbi:hypothetical protein GQ457_06G013740 [Hibiscus cannabinus]